MEHSSAEWAAVDASDRRYPLVRKWERLPSGELTFQEQQRYFERRRLRSERVLAGQIRCKCGTPAILSTGAGSQEHRADCPVCKRMWWVSKEIALAFGLESRAISNAAQDLPLFRNSDPNDWRS